VSEWLAGRDNELALLTELLARLAAGTGGSILVEGEQGIGKTALLRAGLAPAADLGCRVAWGTADELGQQFPLGVMAECLGVAIWTSGVSQGPAADAGPSMPAGDPVLAGMERMLALVDQWCAQSPVVLVAEDLHWADEASMLVWHRLSRAAGQMPLLIAGSMRPVPGQDGLASVRRGVNAGGGNVLSLEPLPAREVAELVGRVAGGRPGRRLATLTAQAGGNPLYATELADALVRGGRVHVSGGVAELVDGPPGTRVTVPTSLAEVIEGRLELLSKPAAEVLRWAAVLGQEFSVTDLETVTGRLASQLLDVVAEAVTAGVIVDAGRRLAFRHGLVRQVVYEEVPASLRSALHLQAARVLAAAAAGPAQVAAQLVAADATEGAARDWARDWLAQAAPALTYQAPQVAAELLRTVLAELAAGAPRREELETDLVRVSFLLWQNEEVERAGRRLLAGRLDPNRRAEIAWFVGYGLLRQGKPAEAVALVEQELARPGMDAAHWARLRALNAMMLRGLGRGDEMAKVAGEALASAELAGDRLGAGYALHAMFTVSTFRSDWPAGLDYIDRALAVIGDDPQAIDLRLLLLVNRVTLLSELSRRDEAIRTCEQALAKAEQAGAYRLSFIQTQLAAVYFTYGRWDDALAELETAIAALGPDGARGPTRGMAALIAAHRDDWLVADRHLAAVADIPTRDVVWPYNAYDLLLARAIAAERSGSAADALAVLAAVLDPSVAELMPTRYAVLPALIRLAVKTGDTEVARTALEAAQQEARDSPGEIVASAAAEYCRGLVDSDPAVLLAAAGVYRSTDRLLECAQAMHDAAVLLADRGDPQAARETFSEAAGLYEALGARWDLAQAAAELRRHGIHHRPHLRRARPAAGWDALTPTETKIAYLIAEGRSNPDVAACLFLSRNTVQTHVSHILAKLSARSRAEIMREALRHPADIARATA
jgi:DNA-binding CsgD family transcriptional regulator